MTLAFDYLEMARECIAEAEAGGDPDRKKALLEVAKLYNQTALAMGAAEAAPIQAAGAGLGSGSTFDRLGLTT